MNRDSEKHPLYAEALSEAERRGYPNCGQNIEDYAFAEGAVWAAIRLGPYETAVKWTLSHIKHSLGDASTYGDTRKSADEIKGWVDAFKFFETAINMRLQGN